MNKLFSRDLSWRRFSIIVLLIGVYAMNLIVYKTADVFLQQMIGIAIGVYFGQESTKSPAP